MGRRSAAGSVGTDRATSARFAYSSGGMARSAPSTSCGAPAASAARSRSSLSALVIGPGYLQSQLHHRIGWEDYATLVWLASSIGVVAGALGSSLDGEDAVRKAAYSRRERERQERNRVAAARAVDRENVT